MENKQCIELFCNHTATVLEINSYRNNPCCLAKNKQKINSILQLRNDVFVLQIIIFFQLFFFSLEVLFISSTALRCTKHANLHFSVATATAATVRNVALNISWQTLFP